MGDLGVSLAWAGDAPNPLHYGGHGRMKVAAIRWN